MLAMLLYSCLSLIAFMHDRALLGTAISPSGFNSINNTCYRGLNPSDQDWTGRSTAPRPENTVIWVDDCKRRFAVRTRFIQTAALPVRRSAES